MNATDIIQNFLKERGLDQDDESFDLSEKVLFKYNEESETMICKLDHRWIHTFIEANLKQFAHTPPGVLATVELKLVAKMCLLIPRMVEGRQCRRYKVTAYVGDFLHNHKKIEVCFSPSVTSINPQTGEVSDKPKLSMVCKYHFSKSPAAGEVATFL